MNLPTRPARRIGAAAAVLALAGTTALAGCGSSSSSGNGESKKTGPEVVKDAAAALKSSSAVHFAGDVKSSDGKYKVDLQLQSDSAKGTLERDGQTVEIVSVGGAVYVKAPAKFYEQQGAPASAAQRYGDHYLKTSGSQADSFKQFNLDGFSDSLTDTSGGAKVEDKVTTDTVDGQDAVVVSQSDGSKLYVAATGEPRPLKITGPTSGSDSGGSGTFSDYGKRQDIQAPADAIEAPSTGA